MMIRPLARSALRFGLTGTAMAFAVADPQSQTARCDGWLFSSKTSREEELERNLAAAKAQLNQLPAELRDAMASGHGISPAMRQKIATVLEKEKRAGLESSAGGITLADVTEALGALDTDKLLARSGALLTDIRATGIPEQISYGFVAGVCSGFALKKVGKAAALVFGLSWMGLQTMVHFGLIEIDHDKVKSVVEGQMDWNNDGVVDEKDIKLMWKHVTDVLGEGIPGNSAFVVGAGLGLRL